MLWNVKKLMPTGRKMSQGWKLCPIIADSIPAKKLVYLK